MLTQAHAEPQTFPDRTVMSSCACVHADTVCLTVHALAHQHKAIITQNWLQCQIQDHVLALV